MKRIITIISIIFLFVTFFIYLFQRHLIYFPTKETPELNKYQANDMKIITLHTKDGLLLSSWYKKAKAGHPTLLYLHGNAGNIGSRIPLVRKFINAGYGVLLLEYRGYGGNMGSPSEQGLYTDGRAALAFLQSQGLSLKRIALYGESLGTGVATKLAAENKVCALVLQSPYTSLSDLASYHYPWILFKPQDKFDLMSIIRTISAPLLILHGKKDDVVPYSQGQIIFKQANQPKKMLSFSNASHNNMWHQPNFAKDVIIFIDKNCIF